MSDILLSGAVRSNLAALQKVTGLLEAAQKRLATGKRVNSALDNPVAYFTASALNYRADGLSNLLDSVSNGYKTVEAASAGIESLTGLVNSAQSIATQAKQSAATTANYIGSVANLTLASSFAVVGGTTITFNDGVTTATITSAGTVTVQQIIDGVNNTVGLNLKAGLTTDGRIQVQATGTNTVVRGGTASAANKLQFGIANGTTAAGTVNTTRTGLATQFDQIRTQIGQMAADAGFNGVNLINGGSLSMLFNEAGTSSFTVSGVTLDAAGLGVLAATNSFQTEKDINDALTTLTAALNTLDAQAASFGANLSVIETRQDFTEGMIETLKAGADNLVLADVNEEGANLLLLQSQQQLLTTALSLAAQSGNLSNLFSRI